MDRERRDVPGRKMEADVSGRAAARAAKRVSSAEGLIILRMWLLCSCSVGCVVVLESLVYHFVHLFPLNRI